MRFVGDVFLVVWRRLEEVPEDPLPWLLGVARRALANRGPVIKPAAPGAGAPGRPVRGRLPRFDETLTRVCTSWPRASGKSMRWSLTKAQADRTLRRAAN
jgi:RNA polymerase sigma-70 factor (ECF subfamily)